MFLELMYITNNLEVALIAQNYGVDRLWVDLETLDKEKRQRGIDTVKSHHTVNDVRIIKSNLSSSKMLVRINHWNKDSVSEIESVINAGADIIMLPYWKTIDEVKRFTRTVDGRCKTTLLLETKEAVDIIDEVLALGGFDEIHIGLNDLHLSYNLDFMFELLTNGVVENLCRKFSQKGIPYGFGGIARIGDGAVPAERIILEHYRLGSTRAILSRTFCDYSKIGNLSKVDEVFKLHMKELREFEEKAKTASKEDFELNQEELRKDVCKVAEMMRKRRMGERLNEKGIKC